MTKRSALRDFLNTSAMAAGALALARTENSAAPAAFGRKPNILFILADQWRGSATGDAGGPNVKTPKRIQKGKSL